MTPELKAALDSFDPHCDLSDPNVAKYKCGSTSRLLRNHLNSLGIENSILCVCGLRESPKNPSPAYPSDFNWQAFGHTVVVVGETWIDFTARQISADYAYPHTGDARTELRKWKHLDDIQ